jgi:predicted dehydrogenase
MGFIGRVHAHAARSAGAVVVGVSTSSPERSERAAETLGAERSFPTWRELVAADDVDVVHICAPNHLLAPIAEEALAAGKHVVCEKPLATDADGAAGLVQAARAAGSVATVPFVYRFYPTVRELRSRVSRGDAGSLHLLHGSYLQDWLLSPEDDNWRVEANLGGASRAFADIGCHWCDLVEFVSGHRITRLAARTLIVNPERARSEHREAFASGGGSEQRSVVTEDAAVLSFTTDRGATGSLVVSQVSPGRKNRLWFELDGSRAAVAFDQEQPERAWVGRREGSGELARDPATLGSEAARYATLPAGHPQGYQDCFNAFVADTYEAVLGGRPEGLPTFDDGLRAARLTEAVLRSAADATWVEVPA